MGLVHFWCRLAWFSRFYNIIRVGVGGLSCFIMVVVVCSGRFGEATLHCKSSKGLGFLNPTV